jgi:xanthine dehydrogenase YagS FAD-binding subunit
MQTLSNFTHIDAKNLNEAIDLLSRDNSVAIAGGTDLLGVMRFQILREYPETVVNLKTISPSLDYIKEEGGVLKIGALTRLEDIATSSIVKGKYTALAQAAEKTASPHIRESGTIGGNICQHNRCWYFWKEENRFDCIRKGGNMCYALVGENRFHSIFGALNACVAVNPSDTAPALVVLNAKIITTKREIAAEDFWDFSIPGSTVLEKDEIVKEIQFPTPAAGVKSAFAKFAIRRSIDFPIANCAAVIGENSASICLNAVYNKPYRATNAENSIKGKTINTENAETAATAGVSNATALPLNRYKISIAKGVIKQAILACK